MSLRATVTERLDPPFFFRVLDNDIKAADKSLLDARRELTNVETSVNITKAKLKELKASAAGTLESDCLL